MPEERKLASILFADIVGSTALGNSEDPELVRRTLARVFAEMRQLLVEHGGTVEKFVGDAVMAVFGVPAVHDDDAERAVRAAFALRERVASLESSLAFPLSLRIGVNSGQVVAGSEVADTLVTGAPVNAAARLQQSASPGEILVGATTRSLTAMGVRYGDARQVEAKGIGSLEAFSALGLESAIPEQRRGLGRLRAPLIGRDAELRLLRESHRKAGEERAAYLVTVYGQAGVGKSRLVAELIEVIGRDRVLRGRCLPYGNGITYWPLQEMLRADARIAPDDARDEASRKLRAAVLAAFGETSDDADAVARRLAVIAGHQSAEESLPGTAAGDLGQELRWGVRRYFEQRAATEPLTLIFDDIHWAEEPMLELIEHLAEWSRAPLFILCLARPELRDRRASWGGGLMNAGAVRLEPLTAEETRRLIAALLAIDDLPETVRTTIVERAQGNPLYVEELLRMLIDAGHVAEREGRWVATRGITELAVPATLQGLLSARLDRLPAGSKVALQRASVVGKVFYPDALAALGPLDGRVDEVLTFAARRDFVIERDERGPGGGRAWQFKHILIRDVAYESLPKEERSRLHDAVGRWLETAAGERRDEYAEIVAYHADQAFRLARELRMPDANPLGRRALDLLLPAARRARRTGMARASLELHQRAGETAAAIGASAAERAEALGFAVLARADLDGLKSVIGAELPAAVAVAREAGPSDVLVQLLANQANWDMDGDPDRAEALHREALACAREVGEPDIVVRALLNWRHLYWYRGELEKDLRSLAEARAEIDRSGSRRLMAFYLATLAANAEMRGDFEAVLAAQAERLDAARDSESMLVRAREPEWVALGLAWLSGDHEAAIAAARRLVAISEDFGTNRGFAKQALGRSLYRAGRYGEAVEQLREAALIQTAQQSRGWSGETRQQLARAELAAGDLAAARTSAELAYGEIDTSDAYSRTTTATALAMVREAEGDVAEADRLHREAVARNEQTGYQLINHEARIEYARFLIRRGRGREARPLLEKARDFFKHPFVAKRRQEVEELLRRCEEARAT
jgi:class 3 adenylate cyclase/tetratricopeptide (TPR) repeat protein